MLNAVIVVYVMDESQQQNSEALASSLQIPIVNQLPEHVFALVISPLGLELWLPDAAMKPIKLDFMSHDVQQRLRQSQPRTELLARAVGIKGQYRPSVLDATAGFGNDAMVLAHLGCPMILCERSSIMCALLGDALARADTTLVKDVVLHCMDAKQFLSNARPEVDVIYLDPMFPERTKSALVKKEMRILKDLVGGDDDAGELFTLAKQFARKRVVVKRSRHAPNLVAEEPQIVFAAKACRFDVYLM